MNLNLSINSHCLDVNNLNFSKQNNNNNNLLHSFLHQDTFLNSILVSFSFMIITAFKLFVFNF